MYGLSRWNRRLERASWPAPAACRPGAPASPMPAVLPAASRSGPV